MTKRLLIDASHAEETRVVVLDGNRLEDFDVETQSRRQLKGNIYLAKVVRVEPSLQAAFVEYGGNRHGFLAFGEIHPDYYQIPVADRQRLIELQEEEARAEEEADEAEIASAPAADTVEATRTEVSVALVDTNLVPAENIADSDAEAETAPDTQPLMVPQDSLQGDAGGQQDETNTFADAGVDTAPELAEPAAAPPVGAETEQSDSGHRIRHIAGEDQPALETVGGEPEGGEEPRPSRQPSRFMRSYKIQEVIRRRQILLIQVVKEERGTKGAALTTYISLAGRYCVLMPNSPRGGGISRKITSAADRRRLKEVTAELEIPRGMGLIVRTAGAARPKPEIKRDGEYLLRLWDDIREQTMASMAPSLIYEEASLIKRAIRDVYSRDIDELLVDGEEGWRAARDYMRMLMPTHVKKVQLWPANSQPLFAHSQVESMLDAMLNPTVQLRSGGYLVINQTEALVAIDVNSGRSTRERGIEETALRTNLEAAEETARQLRLRDLAGLIVIDFIDMESKKHNGMVERRMADALKNDRARIQMGNISHFGLLELSRQRLRPSLAETSLNACPQCGGSGHVRSTESASLHVLREIEEEGGKRRAAEVLVHVASSTALFILNNKRQRLTEIEARYAMRVCFAPDDTLLPAQTRIDRVRAAVPQDLAPSPMIQAQPMPDDDANEADIADDEDDVVFHPPSPAAPAAADFTQGDFAGDAAGDFTKDADHVLGETAAEGEQRRRKRRRRRRSGRREDGAQAEVASPVADGTEQPDIADLAFAEDGVRTADTPMPASLPEFAIPASPIPASEIMVPGHDEAAEAAGETAALAPAEPAPELALGGEAEPARAKRGRRGGRRRRKPGEDADAPGSDGGGGSPDNPVQAPAAYVPPPFVPYAGPTPADPFAMAGLDIFDALEQAEQRANIVVAEAPQPPAVMDQPGDQSVNQPEDQPIAQSVHQPGATERDAGQTIASLPAASAEATPQPSLNLTGPAAPQPVAGAAIQPIIIGAVESTAPAKRGWWRK